MKNNYFSPPGLRSLLFTVVSAGLSICLIVCAPHVAIAAPSVDLQVRVGTAPLKTNQPGQLTDRKGRALTITRLDLLLSQISLQRPDGSWTEAQRWNGFFRAEQPTRRQPLPALPAGAYIGARFSVGVQRDDNHADPNRLRPDDPLHPVVNGMHWGWTGGYVFMALEGHWLPDNAPIGSEGGFSYHLAGDENRVTITLPGELSLRSDSVLHLTLDAARLLNWIDISRDGDSTHSRGQDTLVVGLKKALSNAFTLSVNADTPTSAPKAGAGRHGVARRPYPLAIDARLPSVALPEDNPLTQEGVDLGRQLFNDPRLSRDNRISCASCHRAGDAFSDRDSRVSRGVDGRLGDRNAMPIFNLAWVQAFFWDGRAKSLRTQVTVPIEHPNEMAETMPRVVAKLAADRQTAASFQTAFGGPVTAQRIGLALEQYMLTLISQDSKFDRVLKGADQFTAAEKKGFELFLTEHDPPKGLRGADCFHCHGGSLMTNNQFTNNGLPTKNADTGREGVTHDPADLGKFRTPSLRNVALTAPYMHDGRFATLEEVIEHYDHGVQRSATLDPNLAKHPNEGLRLSPDDKLSLAAFLRTLTDPAFGDPKRGRASPSASSAPAAERR